MLKLRDVCEQYLTGPFGELKCAIAYGSGRTDQDVLAVYTHRPPRNEVVCGRLDVLAIGVEDLHCLLNLLDPVVTEPVLTGSLVYGDEQLLLEAQQSLKNVACQWNCIRHLLQRSLCSYQNACSSLTDSHRWDRATLRLFKTNLSYSISYYYYSKYYTAQLGHDTEAITLAKLVPSLPQNARGILDDLAKLRVGQESMATELIQRWEISLLGGR